MAAVPSPAEKQIAALLIAHGSRRDEANRDLADVAAALGAIRTYPIVEIAYLELCAPSIREGGAVCVKRGAAKVLLLPYFLSAGNHVVNDLETARRELAAAFPATSFVLCRPLSGHELLLDVVVDRLAEAEFGENGGSVRVEKK